MLYFAFYASVVMALECRPHVRPERLRRVLLAFDRVGALAFLFGLLLYLTVLPALVAWESYWTSSLVLFVILDAFLVLRLLNSRHVTSDPEWRATYGWLLVGSAIWLLTDSIEVLGWADLIPNVESGTPLDIVWILSFPAMVVAGRVGLKAAQAGSQETPGSEKVPADALGMGPIVVFAVAMPLLHLFIYRLGWADPALKSPRELVTFVFASILALMALAYQELLRRENRQLSTLRSQARAKLEHQAHHDALTGLPNRNLFREHLGLAMSRAQRGKNHCAVFYCDLDRFKVVNDSLGHGAGDRVLISIAGRLRESIRQSDTVARLGGDEFAILVHDIEHELSVLPVAQHLLAALKEPIVLDGGKHVHTASIGIALYPDDGLDEATLIKNADIAMYQAKLKGRDSYQLFTHEMNQAADARLMIEQGLREALVAEGFELLYQPVIDIETHRLTGCEALLRW